MHAVSDNYKDPDVEEVDDEAFGGPTAGRHKLIYIWMRSFEKLFDLEDTPLRMILRIL